MKVINYEMKQNEELFPVSIGYNDTNLAIAEREAFNGEYTIEENAEMEEIEARTDEVVNEMLGVN